MSVDMYEWRFRKELAEVEQFRPDGRHDDAVWAAKFPAWRALFSSMCLYGHSTGYRLFSYESFWQCCENAYTLRHPNKLEYAPYFKGELRAGMRQRVATWYESGMAETYLYACVVDAIEDKSKCGVVLYDPRVDWKLKTDLFVICNRQAIQVHAYFNTPEERPDVERRRDDIERERKQNTTESSHWNNNELPNIRRIDVHRDDANPQIVNGVRLFSVRQVNQLLSEIYQASGVENGWLFNGR